mmetsp:Transcript_21811/g.60592  ORF Transcript_21811/g.60592 Transcript_21811/m.60592 type:complete len:98 (-) Transcript_21811:1069-1362(-)
MELVPFSLPLASSLVDACQQHAMPACHAAIMPCPLASFVRCCLYYVCSIISSHRLISLVALVWLVVLSFFYISPLRLASFFFRAKIDRKPPRIEPWL